MSGTQAVIEPLNPDAVTRTTGTSPSGMDSSLSANIAPASVSMGSSTSPPLDSDGSSSFTPVSANVTPTDSASGTVGQGEEAQTVKVSSLSLLDDNNEKQRVTLTVVTTAAPATTQTPTLTRNNSPVPLSGSSSVAPPTQTSTMPPSTVHGHMPPAQKLRNDRKLFMELLELMDGWDGNSPLSEQGRRLLIHALIRMQYPWYGGKNTQRLCKLYSRFRACLTPASMCKDSAVPRVFTPTSDYDLAAAKATLKDLDEHTLPPVATVSMIQQARAHAVATLEKLSDRALLVVLLLRLSTHSALTFFLHIEHAFISPEEAEAMLAAQSVTNADATMASSQSEASVFSHTSLYNNLKPSEYHQYGCPARLPLGLRIWRPDSYRQVFDSKNEMISWKKNARHPVSRMTLILKNDAAETESSATFPPSSPEDLPCTITNLQIAVKRAPELPGIEYAFGVFAKMLFGRGAPHTMLIRRRDDPTPFLLSQIESITTFKDFLEKPLPPDVQATIPQPDTAPGVAVPPQHQLALDTEQVGEQIILAILTRPEDGKPENYVVKAVTQSVPPSVQPQQPHVPQHSASAPPSPLPGTADDTTTSDRHLVPPLQIPEDSSLRHSEPLASPTSVVLGLPTPAPEAKQRALAQDAMQDVPHSVASSPVSVQHPGPLPVIRYQIIPIDNDHSFGPSIDEQSQRILEKTVLFCLDLMLQPVHPRIASRFRLLDVNGFLRAWADALAEKDASYLTMWSMEETKSLLTAPKQPCYIGVPLTREIVLRLQRSLLTVQRMLSVIDPATTFTSNSSHPGAVPPSAPGDITPPGTVTYLQLLEAVDPAVGGIYRKILSMRNDMDDPLPPLERYQKVLQMASSLDTASRSRNLAGYILALLGQEVDVTDALRTHAALSVTAAVQEALGDSEPPSANVVSGPPASATINTASTSDSRGGVLLMPSLANMPRLPVSVSERDSRGFGGSGLGISNVIASAPSTGSTSRDNQTVPDSPMHDTDLLDPLAGSADAQIPAVEGHPTTPSHTLPSASTTAAAAASPQQLDPDMTKDILVRRTRARTIGSISPDSVLAPILEFKGDPDRQSRMFAQIKPSTMTHLEQKECLKQLTQICGEWHSLHLSGWYAVKAKYFNRFLDRPEGHPFLNINVLTINDCPRMDEECVAAICDLMPNLRMLKITNCPGLKRIGRFSLFSTKPLVFPELRHLDVSGCANLTRIYIVAPQLEEYFHSGCPALTKVSLGSERLTRTMRTKSMDTRRK